MQTRERYEMLGRSEELLFITISKNYNGIQDLEQIIKTLLGGDFYG